MFTIQGILKVKNNEVQVSDRFKKREFVMTTEQNTQYPQHVQFQLVQDKCSLLDSHQLGEEIKVSFNLRGREWSKDNEIRYFNTLDAWKIERVGPGNNTGNNNSTQQNNSTVNTSNNQQANNQQQASNNIMDSNYNNNGGNDDLPF